MTNGLSILIPVYNADCRALVKALTDEASAIGGLRYEVVVAEDGSHLQSALEVNRTIAHIPYCIYLERKENVGRARIRNFLAHQAQYDTLLFIDCDMKVIREDYLRTYLQHDAPVVYGGYEVIGNGKALARNLRFRYERKAAPRHTAFCRRQKPYQDFHTANFTVKRQVMLSMPFDERFVNYGYEDVLWGKRLKEAGIPIRHIDNPLGFHLFESNIAFVEKTEEALQTLNTFQDELRDYSSLLSLSDRTRLAAPLIRLVHRLTGKHIRRNLCGDRPLPFLFGFYKAGYFTSIRKFR